MENENGWTPLYVETPRTAALTAVLRVVFQKEATEALAEVLWGLGTLVRMILTKRSLEEVQAEASNIIQVLSGHPDATTEKWGLLDSYGTEPSPEWDGEVSMWRLWACLERGKSVFELFTHFTWVEPTIYNGLAMSAMLDRWEDETVPNRQMCLSTYQYFPFSGRRLIGIFEIEGATLWPCDVWSQDGAVSQWQATSQLNRGWMRDEITARVKKDELIGFIELDEARVCPYTGAHPVLDEISRMVKAQDKENLISLCLRSEINQIEKGRDELEAKVPPQYRKWL